MEKPEILAPAGGMDSLLAALYTGADAVYLGAGDFNARRNAHNFDEEALCEAVRQAHLYGAKIYMTINTAVFDDELPALLSTIALACRAGVDQIIAADLGVYVLLRRCAPGLRISGSTQMSIHNKSGVRMLQRLGYDRVVLARELSQKEIAAITRESQIEVEAFVHGALCMCLSGQCYLSSMIGGRSGNRGLCAQPCRLPMKAPDGAEYALSLKDMSLVEQAEKLGELGVKSLKIEGRMKRPEYVAASVSALRQILDEGKADGTALQNLQAVFSRSGFTSGYFDGKLGREMFGTRQKEDVLSAAGVLGELARLYEHPTQRVPVEMALTVRQGEPVSLTVTDPQGRRQTAAGEPPQLAQRRPTDEAMARRALEKTGGTAFYLEQLTLDTDGISMVPVSQLNALRREALDALTQDRRQVEPTPFAPVPVKVETSYRRRGAPRLRARFDRFDQVPLQRLDPFEAVILPAGELLSHWEELTGQLPPDRLWAQLPRAIFDREEAVKEQLERLRALGCRRAVCGNLGGVILAQEAGLEVSGDFGLNLVNTPALEECEKLGLADVTLSFEMSLDRVRRLGGKIRRGLLAYGYLPLMLTRNCVVKNAMGCQKCGRGFHTLTDRTGRHFPAACEEGREAMELYNAVPLSMADRQEEMEAVDFLTLYFTRESREEADKIVEGFLEGRPVEGATRGLYYRKVQ